MSAKHLAESLGGAKRAWLCRCPCPNRPLTDMPNLVVVNTPNGVLVRCMTLGCDPDEMTRDFLDRGLTPLDQRGQS
jgi:hypothetical protein